MGATPQPAPLTRVYLGLGSNIAPEENLALAIRELRWRFGALDLSPVYRNPPVGFDGDSFLNMVVGLETSDAAADIHAQIEAIHGLAGRDRGAGKFVSRPLDIDLLLYGNEVIEEPRFRVPRSDILEYGFVLRPLSELAPGFVHPDTGHTLREHWQAYDASAHPLEPVSLVL